MSPVFPRHTTKCCSTCKCPSKEKVLCAHVAYWRDLCSATAGARTWLTQMFYIDLHIQWMLWCLLYLFSCEIEVNEMCTEEGKQWPRRRTINIKWKDRVFSGCQPSLWIPRCFRSSLILLWKISYICTINAINTAPVKFPSKVLCSYVAYWRDLCSAMSHIRGIYVLPPPVRGPDWHKCFLLTFFFFYPHFYFPASRQAVVTGVVRSSPPGSCLQFLSHIGFSNPTARRFFSECCCLTLSRFPQVI